VRGNFYSADGDLPETDLRDLADLLAAQLYSSMERKVYSLSRQDVTELVARYIDDLTENDRQSIPWLIWDLFQEGLRLEMEQRRRR
jgi:hypothetical protein